MNCRPILLIFILYLPFTAFSQWNEAGQLPVGHVRGLFEIGVDKKLYATGEESFFRATNEKGDAWESIILPKPFTINYVHDYGSKLLIGTDKHGIWEYYPNEQDPANQWKNITDNLFAKETLKGENLSVNAIAATGRTILANVYHEGNPSHGGSHSRIYVSLDGGKKWGRAKEFTNPHNFIFSFTIDNTTTRVIASTLLDGILIGDISETGLTSDSTLILTQVSPFVAKKIISIGPTEFIGLPNNTSLGVLYRSIDNGTTWSQIQINDVRLKNAITDISWGTSDFYLYASTYDGIFKITKDNLVSSRAWEAEYPEPAYISNIRTKYTNKFATAETGVLRRLLGSTQWTKAEQGLKINYVYATHANSKFVLAVTDNGLFRSPVDLITKQFKWEAVERKILVSPQDRFLETRRAAIAYSGTGPTEEIFIATNNAIIRSKDAGITWTKTSSLPVSGPVNVDRNDPTKTVIVSYQENIQSMMFAGNDLYAVAYETPLILKNREGKWEPLQKGLPSTRGTFYAGVIKGMQEISGEVYLYWEDYSSNSGGHDVWDFPDLKGSGIYKLDAKIGEWLPVRSLERSAKIHGFIAYGDSLIFSAQYKDSTYTFHSFNVKTKKLQNFDNPLSESDGYLKEIYNHKGNLFMTNTENKTIFVSADGGKAWTSIEEAPPSTVSSFTVSNDLVYAGITGNGMWYRNFYEFFPIIIKDKKNTNLVIADGNNQVTESNTDTVSITLNQFIPGTTVTLNTRSLTRDKWKEWPVTSDSKQPEKFKIKLPHEQFDEVGLAYYWAITPPEAYQNPAKLTVKTDVEKVAIQYKQGLPVPERLKMNKNPKKTPYLMLSFPLVPDNNTVQEMLGDELNLDEGKGVWRLVSYDIDKKNPWLPLNSRSLLTIGQGYWLAATEGLNKKNRDPLQITTSSGKTIANELKMDSTGNFYYELPLNANDWTQIGNPLLINVDWNDVVSYPLNAGLNLGQLYTYTNNERGQEGKLARFSGGYIKNETSETVLRIPAKRSTKFNDARKSAEQEILQDAVLAVGFSIESQEMICRLSGLGIHAGAQEGLDPYDLVVPPSPGGFPTMRFATAMLEKPAITRSMVPPLGEGQEWEFTVTEVEKEERVTLNWHNMKMEAGKALWLHDLDGERKVDMLSASTYQFTGMRRFRVYYGTEHYLKSHLMPEKSLLAVYPNPLSESATISFTLPENSDNSQVKVILMDAKGSYLQVVHESVYQAGFHELTTDFARKLPQGLYMLALQIDNKGNTQRHYQKVIIR